MRGGGGGRSSHLLDHRDWGWGSSDLLRLWLRQHHWGNGGLRDGCGLRAGVVRKKQALLKWIEID